MADAFDDGPAPDSFGPGVSKVQYDLSPDAQVALDRLRAFCALLPETAEIDGLGHPTFRVKVRSFGVFEMLNGRPTVCVKLPLDHQADLLGRDGFRVEPQTGHYGWTVVELGGPVDWSEVDELVTASYRVVAPSEFVAQLNALLAGD